MKLLDLITKLQEVEKAAPGCDVTFQTADLHPPICTRPTYLLDAALEYGNCLITIGDTEEDAGTYREARSIQKRNEA